MPRARILMQKWQVSQQRLYDFFGAAPSLTSRIVVQMRSARMVWSHPYLVTRFQSGLLNTIQTEEVIIIIIIIIIISGMNCPTRTNVGDGSFSTWKTRGWTLEWWPRYQHAVHSKIFTTCGWSSWHRRSTSRFIRSILSCVEVQSCPSSTLTMEGPTLMIQPRTRGGNQIGFETATVLLTLTLE
eukprot:1131083-Amphidinium_carterae.1